MQLKNIFFTLSEFLKNQVNIDNKQINQRLLKSNSRTDITTLKSSDSSSKFKVMTEIKKNEALNFDLFLDSLALSALYSKNHEESSELEKIIYLADRMCQSQGITKSQLRSGQTFSANKEFHLAISAIKAKMPNIYEKKKNFNMILKSSNCFEELFENGI